MAPETKSEVKPPPAKKAGATPDSAPLQKGVADDTPSKQTETRPTERKGATHGPMVGQAITEFPPIEPFTLERIPLSPSHSTARATFVSRPSALANTHMGGETTKGHFDAYSGCNLDSRSHRKGGQCGILSVESNTAPEGNRHLPQSGIELPQGDPRKTLERNWRTFGPWYTNARASSAFGAPRPLHRSDPRQETSKQWHSPTYLNLSN